MKNTRKMIPAIAMLLISAVMLTTASYAWFTIGTTADATGMNVTAAAASSLLIVDEAAAGTVAAKFDTADNTITFTAIETGLKPATKADGTTSSDVGLKYPATTNLKTEAESSQGVDHLTGAYTGDWVAATANDEGAYFIEYVAYIASAGAAMNGYNLSVTVDFDDITLPVYNATTIDFWVKTTANGTAALKGTLNAQDGTKTTTDANLVKLGTYDIPVAPTVPAEGQTATGDYITVIMRVYVDGALEDANKAGYTYVRNSQIDLQGAGYGFDVFFQAEKAAETTAAGTEVVDPDAQG